MKKIISLLLLAALMLTLVACGATPAVDDSKTDDASTPASTAEEVADEPFVYKHVVIVGIDGMGAYHKGADTPNIDSIFADYAITDVAQSYNPVASGPMWMSMATGVDPLVMRVTSNPNYEPKQQVNARYADALKKYKTIFGLFHDRYPDANIASITGFEDMQTIMWEDADYLYKEMNYKEWWSNKENTEKAVKYIEEMDASKPSLVFVYYIEPDSTGHKKSWGSPEYNAMLTECDAQLGEIYKALEKKGILDDTLLILATDHGGEGTQHGGIYTPAALNITLGFRGKTVSNAKDFDMIFRDIAAVIVEAMDLEPSAAWKGLAAPPVVPEEIFKK